MLNLTIFSAGSFRHVLNELVTIFKQKNPVEVHLHLAPAGLLRQRLEADEYCDIFISANLQNINILSATKCIYNQQILAFNQLILTTLNTEHYQHRNTLDILFDESLRLATSTPIADPCGDYTWHLFELLEQAYPVSGRDLRLQTFRNPHRHVQRPVAGGHRRPDFLRSRQTPALSARNRHAGDARYQRRRPAG